MNNEITSLLENKRLDYKCVIKNIDDEYVTSINIIEKSHNVVKCNELLNEYIYFMVKRIKKLTTNNNYILKTKFGTEFEFETHVHNSFKYNDIIWPSGIIISKEDQLELNDIEISIDGVPFFTIHTSLLLKLFAQQINDNLIYIPIPRKFFVCKSINQKLIHNFNYDIENMYGIPLALTQTHYITFRIISSKSIDYNVIIEHTIFQDILYQLKNEMLFSAIISYQCIGCESNKLYENIQNIRKKYNEYLQDFNIIKICIDCFSSIVASNKNVNYKREIYRMTRLNKILESTLLLGPICELLMEYDEYDWNHEIIIYDGKQFYRIYDDVLRFVNLMCCDSRRYDDFNDIMYKLYYSKN